jgi:Resolvase, N terminal domain
MAEPVAAHLRRDAYIYVRQSTLAQTIHNTESLTRQYDLAGRARDLGWAVDQIVVVDDDLGRSGASAQGRKGFSGLVADVGLGKAGIVLSLECSRLARNNRDWYQLLDCRGAGVANLPRFLGLSRGCLGARQSESVAAVGGHPRAGWVQELDEVHKPIVQDD